MWTHWFPMILPWHNSPTHIAGNEWSTCYYPFILFHWDANVELWLWWIFNAPHFPHNSDRHLYFMHMHSTADTSICPDRHRFHMSWWARDGYVFSVRPQPGNYCDMAWFWRDVCAGLCVVSHCTGGRQQGWEQASEQVGYHWGGNNSLDSSAAQRGLT